MTLKNAVIVAARRSAVAKSGRGALKNTRPDEFGAQVLRAALDDASVPLEMVEDVLVGCAMPEAEQGLNVGRNLLLHAGLPDSVPGATINRYCSSGLQTISMIAERIMVGAIDIGVAGGIESMSMIPMGGHVTRLHPKIVEDHPEIYISMGLTAENVAKKYQISREAQDEFALQSHEKALRAIQEGRFQEEIVALTTREGKEFKIDEGPRGDTNLEALARLRPVFAARGSVTAGNSSQTSDGAAFSVLMSEEKAKELGLTPLARYVGFAVAGVPPEIMGIGPVAAIPRLLKRHSIDLDSIGVIELNEAFA
ncbi:MAG: acetyl-CoA C-acyltransferase, partial [Polyangiaceae bacterium]|nr:acetyl-CoA C-acyltransferase [Polyangiaceae bacterium]